MHPCLEIPELLENILESVDSPSNLVALARTCLDFSEPALDVLWGTYGTLENLIDLMPEGLIATGERVVKLLLLLC